MVSVESVKAELADQAGNIMTLMQQTDEGGGPDPLYWADEMYSAYEFVKKAIQCIDRAEAYNDV